MKRKILVCCIIFTFIVLLKIFSNAVIDDEALRFDVKWNSIKLDFEEQSTIEGKRDIILDCTQLVYDTLVYKRDNGDANISTSPFLKTVEDDNDEVSINPSELGKLLKKAKDFISGGEDSEKKTIDMEVASEPFVATGQLLLTIGIAVLIIVTLIMGIKYMMASANEKATLKKQLIGLVVSSVVIFGAYIIWSMLVKILASST